MINKYNVSVLSNKLSDFFSNETIDYFDNFMEKRKIYEWNFETFLKYYLTLNNIDELVNVIRQNKEFANTYCGIIISLSSGRDDFKEIISLFNPRIYKIFFDPLLSNNFYKYYENAINNNKCNNIDLLHSLSCSMAQDEFEKYIKIKGDDYKKACILFDQLYMKISDNVNIEDDICLYGLFKKYQLHKERAITNQLNNDC